MNLPFRYEEPVWIFNCR